MKRILVLHYSQTGQLTRAARSMLSPLQGSSDVEIVWAELKPKKAYPFPWPFFHFFDTFPECVYLDPPQMEPYPFDPDEHFDLVILTYQVWFLSPALPATAFLKSPEARVLKGKPVITFIACRGMWLSAQESVKAMISQAGGTLIDNIVLVDQGPQWATFVTTPLWLLTGRKEGLRGLLPPAGVSDEEIRGAARFGKAIAQNLDRLGLKTSIMQGLGAVKVVPKYIAGERVVHRSFRIWGRLFRSIGGPGNPVRRLFLVFYILFLITMILTVVPLGALYRALMRPFMEKRLQQKVRELEAPSGSSRDRIADYI